MSTIRPWRFLLITLAGWINRHQQDVIEYLVEEIRIPKGQIRETEQLRLTDDERRGLAVKGKALVGRSVLQTVATIVTPDTSWPGIVGSSLESGTIA